MEGKVNKYVRYGQSGFFQLLTNWKRKKNVWMYLPSLIEIRKLFPCTWKTLFTNPFVVEIIFTNSLGLQIIKIVYKIASANMHDICFCNITHKCIKARTRLTPVIMSRVPVAYIFSMVGVYIITYTYPRAMVALNR
jgi:hypothetical protein